MRHSPPPPCALCAPWCNTPPLRARRYGTRLPLRALCALRGAKTPPPGAERASFSVLSVRSVVQQHPHWRQSAPPCRGKFQTRPTPLYSLSYLRRERMLKVLQRSCPLTNGLKWPRIIDPERFVVTPVAALILYS